MKKRKKNSTSNPFGNTLAILFVFIFRTRIVVSRQSRRLRGSVVQFVVAHRVLLRVAISVHDAPNWIQHIFTNVSFERILIHLNKYINLTVTIWHRFHGVTGWKLLISIHTSSFISVANRRVSFKWINNKLKSGFRVPGMHFECI